MLYGHDKKCLTPGDLNWRERQEAVLYLQDSVGRAAKRYKRYSKQNGSRWKWDTFLWWMKVNHLSKSDDPILQTPTASMSYNFTRHFRWTGVVCLRGVTVVPPLHHHQLQETDYIRYHRLYDDGKNFHNLSPTRLVYVSIPAHPVNSNIKWMC